MTVGERRLIVNADDLGRTAGINAGIFESHSAGILTSATLMVNCPAAREAAEQLDGVPRLGVGLHLVMAGGTPVLPPAEIPSLVDAEGRFPAGPDGVRDAVPAEVLAEARAQLALFQELTGRLPTHFDSHYHSHRIPVVCDALIELGRETSCPVRCASPAVRDRLIQADVTTTDAFVEDFYDRGATLEGMLEILHGLEPGVTEVMCHPGRVDDALRADSSYVEAREREIEILTDPRVRAEVERLGIELVTFEACARSSP